MDDIRIYLVDGTYDGVITMDSSSSKFKVARIPKDSVSKYSVALEGKGLYFLLVGGNSVYVGQSSLDDVGKRIMNTHAGSIDSSWHTVVAFINPDNSISSNELLYIENALCEYAHQKFKTCLTTSPTKANCNDTYRKSHYGLNIAQIKSCNKFIEDIKYYIECFPKTIFPTAYQKGIVPPIPAVPDPDPKPVTGITLYLSSKKSGASAVGIIDTLDSKEITVKAGARLSAYSNLLKQRKQEGMEKLRQDMITTGKFVDGVLKEDYKFSSTSTAAAVILGTASNGNEKWKDENGVSLGELKSNSKT